MSRLVHVSEASSARWREIASRCDYATWFHTREWAELWQAETDGAAEPIGFLFEFEDGREALLPAVRHRALGGLIRHYLSSATGKYGGWISDAELDAEADHQICAWLGRLSLTVRRNPFSPYPDGLPCTRSDFTQVLDLRPGFDALMKGWSRKHVASLAKAHRSGITVHEAGTPDQWREYFAIYQDSVRRWGESTQTVHNWSLFERLQAQDPSCVRLWLATHSGRPAAGAICFYHKNHVVYWHGASRQEAMAHCPAFAVLHRAIERACAAGYRWFDFNPSGGLQGVVHFKAGFGTCRMDTGVYDRRGPVARAVRMVVQRLRERR